jgi:hypothetical protein
MNRTAKWLREEIRKLAERAEAEAQEDTEDAEAAFDHRVCEARADCERHYAQQLRRILAGKTWDENFIAKLMSRTNDEEK